MKSAGFKCGLVNFLIIIVILALVTLVSLVLILTKSDETRKKEDTAYYNGAVAADVGKCSDIGVNILKRNGSAVDAAIATLFCVGVSNIQSSGIGGGLFMVVYINKTRQSWFYNGREKAPGNASKYMFVNNTRASKSGPLSVGVPGEVKAMFKAWQEHGKLSWGDLIQPAIDLCKTGFPIHKKLNEAMLKKRDELYSDPGFRKLFFKNNDAMLGLNEILMNPELGETLEEIAKHPMSFYNGTIATTIAKDIQSLGGIITEEDLRNYDVQTKKAMKIDLDGTYSILASHPPSSGAVMMMILKILKGFNFTTEDKDGDINSIKSYHRIIEAFKFAYAYRALLGDPDYESGIDEVIRNMTNDSFTKNLRLKIFDNATHNISYYGGFYSDWNDGGTTHLSVVSKNGDAVAVTSTINTWFGSKIRSPALGIVYNNEMDDFSTPNLTNVFGVEPSPRNYIKPGKRMMSSMSPTVVIDKAGRVRLALGGSGGTRITTGVAQVFINYLWFQMTLEDAVKYPRLHHQLVPTYIRVENNERHKLQQSILDGLEKLGHLYKFFPYSSVVQAVAVDERGRVYAMSDPRKNGRAACY